MAVHYYSHRHIHEYAAPSREAAVFRAVQVIWFLAALVEAVLLLRFGLKLLGANSGAPFSALVYSVSGVLLSPFRYILPAVQSGRSILEWSTVLGMAVYWFVAWAVSRLLLVSRPAKTIVEEA